MLLKDHKDIKLPPLNAGSFSGLDRLEITLEKLILMRVERREDDGRITLLCKAVDGPEQKSGQIRFSRENLKKQESLYTWFLNKVGDNISSIYSSDFSS